MVHDFFLSIAIVRQMESCIDNNILVMICIILLSWHKSPEGIHSYIYPLLMKKLRGKKNKG